MNGAPRTTPSPSLGRLTPDRRARLKRLSPETQYAVKAAFIEWVETARAAGYEPIARWDNFLAEVDHSALLQRLLQGKLPLPVPPPKRHAYPDYEAVEGKP